MGLAFPKRLLRSSLGPSFVNNYPVENPASDIGDTQFNAAFAIVAAAGLLLPRATLVAAWNGSALVATEQEEAWNDDHDQAHPTPARTGVGTYTYTFASSYNDETGAAVPTVLTAARVAVGITAVDTTKIAEGYAWINPTNQLQVLVYTYLRVLATGVATATDLPFWLAVR